MKVKKSLVTVSLLITLGCTVGPVALQAPTTVAEASALSTLADGAAAMAYVIGIINNMDNSPEGQRDSLAKTKEQTGYLNDYSAQERVKTILENLSKSPSVKRSYEVYVNPDTEFNAFMTIGRVMSINKGALDKLDDHELAYVMAHEIAHGENKDVVNGLKKRIGLSTALSIYTGGSEGVAILSSLASNYLSNQVFTMGQEKKADELGFKILADSDYNIGGAAAAMAVMRNEYGDNYREGLLQVIAPNNHPKSSDRVKDNINRMYKMTGNRVNVTDGMVIVNGDSIYKPAAEGRYTGEERAYYMAGKLVKEYSNNRIAPTSAHYSDATVYVNDVPLVTTPNSDVALQVATNLNNAFIKAPAKSTKNSNP